ncbi:hypothetical protein NQ314_005646 [Rhamnusium bicolor]|uniref:TIL domain-containing protein n=1 Tax=Rhamnusium bicolor TaxID=1586634 RepID=A0AAV8ZEK9_9CUCU|nr:hypothetical protein NQ314_005646 [Rhamnusium bicolor]
MNISVNIFSLLMVFNIALAYPDSAGIACEDSNTSYNECGRACVSTCQNPTFGDGNCFTVCAPGCFCNQGFIRDEESNKCVRIEDCPQ